MFPGFVAQCRCGDASMVKLVDTADLKSVASRNGACRFDSGSRHQIHFTGFGITQH